MPNRYQQRAVVLLVEDNPDDVVMVREAFEQSLTPVQLYVVSNGEQAVKFARRTGADAPRPSLILLDLNLPILGGLEVLADLKSDPDLLTIPVVVLATSRRAEDIRECYSRHANAYIVKPSDFDGFAHLIQQLAACFLNLISLPP
ncbi:MAG: response regulator [Actinobacteria bacterium]|nr:response regulator [Actinomycetota bacterium]